MEASVIFDALATIPKLKKLNLSRNRLEAWHATKKFPMLKELYFAFNLVQNESQLIPAVTTNKSLTYLVITGNPFAVNQQHDALEVLLAERYSRGGELVNEALNPPTYLRSAKTTTHQVEDKQ